MPSCTITTPIGPLCIHEEDGAICAIDFTDEADLSGILAAAGRPVGGWA